MTVLFWSSVALLVAGLWLRHRAWVEPLPGELYLLDGRMVTVFGRDADPNPFALRPRVIVTAPWMTEHVPITANYWRRARPAASNPPRLLDEARRKGAS